MIDPDRRKAIYQLHLAGVPMNQIGRQFHVSPRTVRTIVRQEGNLPQTVRKDKIHIDPELLGRLYRQCDGWMQRVHEILVEDEGVQVSYPTLTRLVRELGLEHRPASKTKLIPAQAFEHECHYLTELPAQLPAPYWPHERGTDEYGYVAVEGNYYWIPGTKQEDVKVLRYADHLKIYRGRTLLAEYPLPADGVKNARFSPAGQPPPRHLPKHRHHGSQHEEQRLRALDPAVAAYVDFALQTPGRGTCAAGRRHRFLRELFALSRKVTPAVFAEALTRARRYRVVDLETLQRIAWLSMSQGQESLPDVEVDESFRQRPAYQEGFLTDEPDLSVYDETPEKDDPTHEPGNEDHDG